MRRMTNLCDGSPSDSVQFVVVWLRMSTSIAILKVLTSYPGGCASVASINADLRMLASPEWFARMRALGVRAGPVNLFSAKLVTRDVSGWTITEAGRQFLARLERGERIAEPAIRLVSSADRKLEAAQPGAPDTSLSLSA
jgi:hypothetical protein